MSYKYRIYPKYWETHVWENSVDPGQTPLAATPKVFCHYPYNINKSM